MTQNEKNPSTICFNGKEYQLNYVLEKDTLLPTPDFEKVNSAALVGNELWVLNSSLVVPNLPIHPSQEPRYISKWVLAGHIKPTLVGKENPVPKHPRYIKLAGTQQWVENPRYGKNPNPAKTVGRIIETTQGQELLTINGWVTVPDKYLGVWPTEEELPEDDAIAAGTGMLWRGELYSKDKEGWRARMGSKVPTGESKEGPVDYIAPNILGSWDTDLPLPDPGLFAPGDGFAWRGSAWVVTRDFLWVEITTKISEEGFAPFTLTEPQTVASTDAPSNSWAEVSSYDALNILGSLPLNLPLPDPSVFKPGDSFFWRKHMWVCDNNKQWAQLDLGMPESGLLPFTSRDFEAYQTAARDNDFEHQLDLAMDDDWNDKGSMARVLLETRKENKRLKRNRFIAGVLWRLLFLGILLGAGYGGYRYIFASIQTGRYEDERSCKVSKGGLTITGKRTFNYPYKSLFGYRLLDEKQVIVKTIVDIKGDRLTVTGFNGQKYWQTRVNMGERGILILKDADTYMFQTDKDLIVATSGGFCNPIQRELSDAELKQPELDIIK